MKYIIKISLTISSLLLSFNGYTQEVKQTGNGTASCDSTCITNAAQSSQTSNLQQRVIACQTGFTGTKLQTRIKLENGNWSEWVDKNINDTCICQNTYETKTLSCGANETGSKIERRNWTCSDSKNGSWSSWTTQTNTCQVSNPQCGSLSYQYWSKNGLNCVGQYTNNGPHPIGTSITIDSYKGYNGATGSGTFGPFYCMASNGVASWNVQTDGQYFIPDIEYKKICN